MLHRNSACSRHNSSMSFLHLQLLSAALATPLLAPECACIYRTASPLLPLCSQPDQVQLNNASHDCSTSLSQNCVCLCTLISNRGRHQHRPSHTHCAVDGQHHGRAHVCRLPLCAQVTHEQRDQVQYLSRSTGQGQENGLLAIWCERGDSWAARQLTAHAGHCRVVTYGTVCLKLSQYGHKGPQCNAFGALIEQHGHGFAQVCSSGKAGTNAAPPPPSSVPLFLPTPLPLPLILADRLCPSTCRWRA